MKYLREFQTTAEYDAAKPNLILPNVSVCEDAPNTVHYNPNSPAPPTPTYESVDLGLPSGTLWAKWNVGATSETEYGNYYQYGKGADDYFVTSGQSNYEGEENPLATSADTATQVMGGDWHMPTQYQFIELTANTTYEWTTIDGVNGGKFTAQNGNYVFFPAAGLWRYGDILTEGSRGFCWSSEGHLGSTYANLLYFMSDNNGYGDATRLSGLSVRGVIG